MRRFWNSKEDDDDDAPEMITTGKIIRGILITAAGYLIANKLVDLAYGKEDDEDEEPLFEVRDTDIKPGEASLSITGDIITDHEFLAECPEIAGIIDKYSDKIFATSCYERAKIHIKRSYIVNHMTIGYDDTDSKPRKWIKTFRYYSTTYETQVTEFIIRYGTKCITIVGDATLDSNGGLEKCMFRDLVDFFDA